MTHYKNNAGSLTCFFQVVIVAGLLSIVTGCTKNFKEYNTPPDGIPDEVLTNDFVNIGAFFPQMQRNVIIPGDSPGDGSQYQIAENLNADLFSGYMATSTLFGSNYNYKLNRGWSNACYNHAYSGLMSGWLQVKKRSAAQYPHLYALATIIKVAGMHRLTDKFGPVPYTQYGLGGFSSAYDGQEPVYNLFFKELDSSIATLTAYVQANPKVTPAKKFDNVYGGDYIKWIRFANSLKLRLAMHIAYANATLAKQRAEEAISNSYGVITDNSDNAYLSSGNAINVYNALWTINDPGYGDINAGAVLTSFLKGYKDPRTKKYVTGAPGYNGDTLGVRMGGIVKSSKDHYATFSGLAIALTDPLQWMTCAEVYFLRAEGALRGWNMGGTAQSFYEMGIRRSFQQYQLGDGASYIADNTSKPAAYTDPLAPGNNVLAGSPDLSTITIQWNDGDGVERNLERIITQKWLAMYPNGQEAWTEFRRTGYPKLWPILDNQSGNTVDTKIQIRRLNYPQDELNNNATGVAQGIQLLGGQGDTGGTLLWWDKKPH